MALGNNNDEEFDWEAAVAEIDDTCDRSALAAMLHEDAFPTFVNGGNGVQNSTYTTLKQNKNEVDKKLSKAIWQSTLDNFVEVSEKHLECHQTYHPSSTTNHGNNDVLYNKGGIKSDIDPVAAQTWTYPVNVPLRDYQFSIVKTALFSNTLVSLPTGLGKTLIAAVVMYNYYRWFPAGKIVFTAPSRPLVMQQIEACHNIVGIPQEWTIDMTGQMNPAQRSAFWQSKRVFFVTPQVLEKDIQSGSCLMKQLVCLVVDEAHRAMGNYAYCVVVREIMAVPVQLRMLALTATPGSKQATIQTVIDNLQISTLEYRNENDPDVRQYTHNKNIELITVAMDKESINVSNLLLEVITPVVQKLCSLGVFYSKDVTKLTPFEFLTARDKFRQSPPAFLAQPQYGEVESYFGVAITLYHIYKLLFSHGIRPALEMLQKKLQQGSFARVMGRNETLWQAKACMQQRIRHGDPNPKVLKMKEIIVEHFQSKDLGNSRVIIFTNFRESVKDIMESLVILGDAVKAMEFIGQSSGKSSKGQSQKVQQAVLQKFRAGGYNTIVATSIGEEGLDIMEVDLVICFDANVSPLRMIQRMGRTGRKRDGRVVILASKGSELQGYLKKQAKGKALGKHMYNGGINSFNFHSSPRMVPHGYQPEVQFVEMSIEKFIRRGRRSREDAASTDPGVDKLSESEMNLLGKYFDSSTEEFWKPSLIAFPHYQLFPSRVYNVKHSFRTTEMLIDTSQFLQEHKSPFMASKNFLLNNEVGTSSTEHLQHVSDDANKAELEGKWADITVPHDTVPEQLHFHPFSPSEQSDKVVTNSQGFLHKMDASGGQCCEGRRSLGKHKSTTSGLSMHGTSNAAMQDKNLHGTFCEGNDSLATHKSPSSEVLNTEFVSIQYKEMMPSVSCSSKTSLHRCLFNTGFVSVSSDGRVIISSPPTLPLLNRLSSCVPFMSGNNSAESLSGRPVSPPMKMGSPKQIEVGINPSFSTKEKTFSEVFRVSTPPNDIMAIDSPEQIKVSSPDGNLVSMIDSLKQIKVSTPPSCQRENSIDVGGDEPQTPPCSGKLFGIPEEVVLATPDSCYAKFPCDFKESILPPVSNAYARYIDFSPYLKNLAERGIVTEPPTLAFSKDGHAAKKSLQQPICDSVNENSKTLAFGIVASSWEVEDPITYLREKDITDHAINTGTEVCKTPEGNKFAAPAHVSPEILKSSNMKLKGLSRNVLHDNAEQLNFECLSISNSSAMKGHSTPLVKHKSNSCSEDWCLSNANAKSVQKPRKFKRLFKYKKHSEVQVSVSPSEMRPKRNKKLDINNGKRHSEISVHAFIDDEAEVSCDERVSTDEDDENDGNEEASETDNFIDDRLELTAALPTQADGGQFDMMAMYRQSLFTQSPTEELHPWARICQSRVYSGKEISDHSEMSNASADTYAGSHVISVDNSSSPSPMKNTGIKTLCSSLLPFQNAVEESLIVDLDTCSSKEKNSNIARKRKFCLQQADPTEMLTVLENRVSSSVVRNLREDFGTPAKQIKVGEPIDHTFDDDLFEGLDLDALEAEAAKMARSRSNMNPTADKSCWWNTVPLDVGYSTKPASFWNAATNIKEIKRTSVQVSDKHDYINDQGNRNADNSTKVLEEKKLETANDIDMVFFCSPSFDLGI